MKIWNVIILFPKLKRDWKGCQDMKGSASSKFFTNSGMTLSGMISSRYRISRFGGYV